MAIKMVLQRALEDEYMQQIRDLGVETVVVESEEDILSAIEDADAYFGGMSPQILKAAKKLRWVQATSAGLDGYYFPELRESDLTVTNIRGIYSDVIADHVFSMVMAFARGLHHYIRKQSQSKWDKARRSSTLRERHWASSVWEALVWLLPNGDRYLACGCWEWIQLQRENPILSRVFILPMNFRIWSVYRIL